MTITAEHLTITLEDGRELTGRTPVELAHKWAEAEHRDAERAAQADALGMWGSCTG